MAYVPPVVSNIDKSTFVELLVITTSVKAVPFENTLNFVTKFPFDAGFAIVNVEPVKEIVGAFKVGCEIGTFTTTLALLVMS